MWVSGRIFLAMLVDWGFGYNLEKLKAERDVG